LPANFSKRNTLKLKQQTHLPTNYQLSYFSNFNKISIILLYDLSNQLKHSNFKKKIKHKQTNFAIENWVEFFFFVLVRIRTSYSINRLRYDLKYLNKEAILLQVEQKLSLIQQLKYTNHQEPHFQEILVQMKPSKSSHYFSSCECPGYYILY